MIQGRRRARHFGRQALAMLAALAAAYVVQRPVVSAIDVPDQQGQQAVAPTPAPAAPNYAGHGAVGTWFGKAMQVCELGVAPSVCAQGHPAVVLFMTPILAPDGSFYGDDTLTLGAAPFGPHTTAFGTWAPTSPTEFRADYVFMLKPFPPVTNSITAGRLNWSGTVVDATTLVGWVNVYLQPTLPLSWTRLLDDEYPSFPDLAKGIVSPTKFAKDPTLCRTEGCPLIFKFTIKRISN